MHTGAGDCIPAVIANHRPERELVRAMIAFVREISPRVDRCEAAAANRAVIDPKLARKQHSAFVAALRGIGVQVDNLGALSEQPDGVFVEDCAIVLPEAAILSPSGRCSRRCRRATRQFALAKIRMVDFGGPDPRYHPSGTGRGFSTILA